jgi:OmpA-OmpF porin, OOP family
MRGQQETRAGLVFGVVLLLCTAVTGGAFYRLVLPKFQPQYPSDPPAPPPATANEPLYPLNPTRQTSVPQLTALPGTTMVRLAHHTANAHQVWGLANMGKVTDPGSLLAQHGITMHFRRLEHVTERIAALQAMAALFNDGDPEHADSPAPFSPAAGVHFFTLGGDASSWALSQTNQALRSVHADFEAEIIGFSGVSAGEDTFMGLADWQENPQKARGGVVAGVPYDSGWSVLVFWCAQNDVPFNADQAYYDPRALNFLDTDSPKAAAELYVDKKTVERIFLADGLDRKGSNVPKGHKGILAISGVVTRTPWEKHLAAQRGGLVTIASTKHYPNHTPQFLVGLKQWNQQHREAVIRMLAAMFEANQLLEKSQRDLKAQRLEAKSDDDYRWQAARYGQELFNMAPPQEWYASYESTTIKDRRDVLIEVGGASPGTLQRNLLFFGLGEVGPDRGQIVYSRFARLAKQYGAPFAEAAPAWDTVFNKAYLQEVLQRFPALAQADPRLPTFVVAIPNVPQELPSPLSFETGQETLGSEAATVFNTNVPQELSYDLPFEKGQETFGPEAETVLTKVLEQIVRAGDVPTEIHGYTDSYGSAESNMALSRRRGEAVYHWLQQKLGTAFPKNIQVVPHGANDLFVKDQIHGQYIPELMAQNRRVVLKIGTPASNP